MNVTRATLLRPAVVQRACRTLLKPLRLERGSLIDVSLGPSYAYGSRMSSGDSQTKDKNRKPEWHSPDFTVPAEAKDSPILKQFKSVDESRLAYGAYRNDYLPIRTNSKNRWNSPYMSFGRFFLRENCQCSECIHPDTRQKINDTFSIPENIDVVRIEHNATDVKIEWTDGHQSSYPRDWLDTHKQFTGVKPSSETLSSTPNLRGLSIPYNKGDPYPEVTFEEVMSKDSAVLDWLWKIYTVGFCFINGVPATPEATKTLIERIAFIRHTHYGGFWDFTADLTFKDTAYTNEFLGGHTDNTYFTDPARLQLFHLLSHTDGSGGESLLVDTFAAAAKLRQQDKTLYKSLITERHSWHSSGNEDVCIQPSVRAPVFSLNPDTNSVYQVRWNDYDRAPKSDWTIGRQKLWYKAARRFNEILKEESRQIVTQLQPGKALIFDNWRMLHGRTEFTGKRRMCGGYVNNDDFISKLRLLKFGRERVLNSIGTTPSKNRVFGNANDDSVSFKPADIY